MFEPDDKGGDEGRKLNLRDLKGLISSTDGEGFRFHDYSDIGKFTIFPQSVRDRVFPSRCYGRIDMTDVEQTDMLGVQAREESVRLTNDFHRLTLPS